MLSELKGAVSNAFFIFDGRQLHGAGWSEFVKSQCLN